MRIGDMVMWLNPYSKEKSFWYIVSFWKKSTDIKYGKQKTPRDSKFVTEYGLSTHFRKKEVLGTPRGYRFVNKEEIL